MRESKISEEEIKNTWRTFLITGDMPENVQASWFEHKSMRPIIKRLPRSPRCDICYMPFKGIGGYLTRTFLGVEASKLNPHMCNLCERFAGKYHGGVEIETAVMFIDVRNSTPMAEKLSAEAFSKKINRFYRAVTAIFYRNYGWVQKFQGDEVGGFFVPGFAGTGFATKAVKTGRQALKSLGYNGIGEPWIQAGVGIHTGTAYVGSVMTSSGASDISILGDTVNIAARLTSQAASGEIIISEAARKATEMSTEQLEYRKLALKGKSAEFDAWVMRI